MKDSKNTRRTTLGIAAGIAAVGLLATAGGAQASGWITGSQIKTGTVTGSNIMNGTITGLDIADRTLGLVDLSPAARASLHGQTGARGTTGTTGTTGAKGTTGAAGVAGTTGVIGVTGAAGTTGAQGTTGVKGENGKDGKDAPAATYGVGNINVSRGGAAASTWQQLSTDLGSPVGDTVSGTFRFTCSEAKAPCAVSVSAYATTSGVMVYPRVLITKDSIDTGAPLGTCEYGDGSDNNGAVTALSNAAVAVPLGIGGSLDCGSAQAYPANGVASTIEVPAGYYNVTSTLHFFKS
jgi:hypothetical protein